MEPILRCEGAAFVVRVALESGFSFLLSQVNFSSLRDYEPGIRTLQVNNGEFFEGTDYNLPSIFSNSSLNTVTL